jgi:putative tricarboxylic transport membrane protein
MTPGGLQTRRWLQPVFLRGLAMSLSILSSIFVTALGILYTVSTFSLPPAAMGRPDEPKIFPAMLGIALILMGTALIIQEIRKLPKAQADRNEQKIKFGKSEQQIALTILNGIVYAFLFNIAGYVFSTVIFLSVELFIFSGLGIWKKALAISALFSAAAYLIFDILLGIYLPKSFLGIF